LLHDAETGVAKESRGRDKVDSARKKAIATRKSSFQPLQAYADVFHAEYALSREVLRTVRCCASIIY